MQYAMAPRAGYSSAHLSHEALAALVGGERELVAVQARQYQAICRKRQCRYRNFPETEWGRWISARTRQGALFPACAASFIASRTEVNRAEGVYEDPVDSIQVAGHTIQVYKAESRNKAASSTIYQFRTDLSISDRLDDPHPPEGVQTSKGCE